MLRKFTVLLVVVAICGLAITRSSRAAGTDSVTVEDQAIQDGSVVVGDVKASVAGWIAIHNSADGTPVIGQTYVHAGDNPNVSVDIDMDAATATMTAMLHIDAGKPGVYEFPGPDGPVMGSDSKPINPPFKVIGVDVDDQLLDGKTVSIGKIIAQQDGWIAIHTSADGLPVIGQAPIKAGINEDVTVDIDASKATDRMTAMIHIDAGKVGTYEFPGPDAPATLGKAITNEPFWTTDHVRIWNQKIGDDNMVTLPYILAKQDGWLVIHSTAEGFPGIGHVAIKKGLNEGVKVKIDDPKTITPTVLAMLHIDAGTIGTYEFPGADAPVMGADGKPVAPMMLISEGVLVHNQSADAIKKAGAVIVDGVVANANGWIVIHSSADGFPVIGESYVHMGANSDVWVPIDTAKLTDPVTAMLHIDAGQAGVYEFPGADAPVMGADGKPVNPPISTK